MDIHSQEAYEVEPHKAYQWWRWPLMPFAAFAGATLGAIALYLFQWLSAKFTGFYTEDGWYFKYIVPYISHGAWGYFYAIISFKVAPSGKLIAGTVMVTLLGLVTVIAILFAWFSSEYTAGEATRATVGSAICLVAAIVGLSNED